MVTLPKRKLPKLWYSKSDYKKERENETEKLSEQLQNDDHTKITINNETAEPLRVENQTQQNDIDSNVPPANDTNPLAERENQSTTTREDNVQPNEISAAQTENQMKQLENENKSEPQPVNEPPSTQSDIQENISESENKLDLIANAFNPD